MPKTTNIILQSAQIINKFLRTFTSLGKPSLALTLVTVIMITSFWAHTTRAEAPLPVLTAGTESDASAEVLVDGLTAQQRAAKIDAFYVAKGDLPLAGHGAEFVAAADKYDIDWRLVAAIGLIESTGGAHACKKAAYSAFGWGSCKISFSSYEESIDVISKNLAGENPATARHYDGKSLTQILDAYNPPSVRPNYKKLVMKSMDQIASIDADAVLAMK